jgi:hypothetical protein
MISDRQILRHPTTLQGEAREPGTMRNCRSSTSCPRLRPRSHRRPAWRSPSWTMIPLGRSRLALAGCSWRLPLESIPRQRRRRSQRSATDGHRASARTPCRKHADVATAKQTESSQLSLSVTSRTHLDAYCALTSLRMRTIGIGRADVFGERSRTMAMSHHHAARCLTLCRPEIDGDTTGRLHGPR